MNVIFTHIQNMALPLAQKLSVDKANMLLIDANQKLLEESERGQCTLELYLDKQELPAYKDIWIFPSDSFDFLKCIEKNLIEEDELTPEIQQFLELIEKEMQRKTTKKQLVLSKIQVFDWVKIFSTILGLGIAIYLLIDTQAQVNRVNIEKETLVYKVTTKVKSIFLGGTFSPIFIP